MTEQAKTDIENMAEQVEIQSMEEHPPPQKPPLNMVRIWTFIVMGICMVFLAWYLWADRITPYTSQARLYSIVVPIAPEVAGPVISVAVKNNQMVEAGQELFRIDKYHYKLALQIAQAQYEAAQQSMASAAAAVDEAVAALSSRKANLVRTKQDALRMQNIRREDPGAISIRRLEMAEMSFASAQGTFAGAEAKLTQARENLGRVGERNSRLLQAQANLDLAQHNLDQTVVRAPARGLVTGVHLEKGKFADKGSPQMTFVATEDYWVQAEFTENNLGHLREGTKVKMVFDVFPGRIFIGSIREMGYGVAVDSTPPGALPTIENKREWLRDAQRFPVLIDFDMEEKEANRILKIGSQVTLIAYTGDHPLLNRLADCYIFLVSIFTYAY